MAETVFVEILSADPIGPLSLAQGRTAVQGDIFARLLSFLDHDVRREYYVNEMGRRAVSLCDSARACLLSDSEGDAVEGRFDPNVRYIADRLMKEFGASLAEASEEEWSRLCASRVPEIVLDGQKETLERLGIRFDSWFEEKSLSDAAIQAGIDRLVSAGKTREIGGALWLIREDGDRALLRRENGGFSYFAVDIAYHLSKIERGANRLVDIWGPAYHRHRDRLQAAMTALQPKSPLEVVVSGEVRFESDGMPVNYLSAASISLDPLLESDAGDVRYRLNCAPPEEELVLEVDALNGKGAASPVSAARVIVASLGDPNPPAAIGELEARLSGLTSGSSAARLAKRALSMPETIRRAESRRRPDLISVALAELTEACSADGGKEALASLDPGAGEGIAAAFAATLDLLGAR